MRRWIICGIETFFRRIVLKNFLTIDLSGTERASVDSAIREKYAPATFISLLLGVMCVPMILFIDTTILGSILVPITVVAGTAWFAISLSNMKKKFEEFGMELTVNMYRSFATSLVLLIFLGIISINPILFHPLSEWGKQYPLIVLVSWLLGSFVIFDMIYQIFIGSMKYDVNDSMLAGQNEAAEKFFKQSLSVLHICSEQLKLHQDIQVANYYLGLAFASLFAFAIRMKGRDVRLEHLQSEANMLRRNPEMPQSDADAKLLDLIRNFLKLTKNISNPDAKEHHTNILHELIALETQVNVSQELVDIRFSVILEGIEHMLENQGESLFVVRQEIERKYRIPSPPPLDNYPYTTIDQGYLPSIDGIERRIRREDAIYTRTDKKALPDGSREETETYISQEAFDPLWEQTKWRRIRKKRYRIPYERWTIELDIFDGENAGLIIAEVEFESQDDMTRFTPPEWFGADVTNEKQYKNASLAK